MSHRLFRNRMAFVGTVPWHGLGISVMDSVTAKDMCAAAGLDWSVKKEPAPGARIINAKKETYNRYLVLRDAVKDESGPVALGIVSSGYELLQNTEAFAFFEPFINSGFARFHTAGALGNGERVWVLAKLNEQIVVAKDDVVDRYLLLSNNHDGSGAVSVRFTPIRVVCQNTLNFAKKNSSGVISIRHTRHLARHLAKAQTEQLKAIINKTFSNAGDIFGKMVLHNMSAENIDIMLESLFPRTDTQKCNNDQPERWQRIKFILEDKSVTPHETKNTLWALYNAIVRDEDYRQTREALAEARLNRVWFGSGHDVKVKALAASRNILKSVA